MWREMNVYLSTEIEHFDLVSEAGAFAVQVGNPFARRVHVLRMQRVPHITNDGHLGLDFGRRYIWSERSCNSLNISNEMAENTKKKQVRTWVFLFDFQDSILWYRDRQTDRQTDRQKYGSWVMNSPVGYTTATNEFLKSDPKLISWLPHTHKDWLGRRLHPLRHHVVAGPNSNPLPT